MPSESLLNSGALRHRTYISAQDGLAPDWFPTSVPSARENPVVGSDVLGRFFPFRECLQNSCMNRHGLLRGFCLTRTHHSTHDRVEQFMTARMIEKDREYISDFRATALSEWQTTQP